MAEPTAITGPYSVGERSSGCCAQRRRIERWRTAALLGQAPRVFDGAARFFCALLAAADDGDATPIT
jgi:hypothetical protein